MILEMILERNATRLRCAIIGALHATHILMHMQMHMHMWQALLDWRCVAARCIQRYRLRVAS